MKILKVQRMGEVVQGVRLHGDSAKQLEPTHFRILLPFGDVDIARTADDEYWVHVRVNRPQGGQHVEGITVTGRIQDARIDAHNEHGGTIDAKVLNNPQLYHLAVRLGPDRAKKPRRKARQ